MELQHCFHSFVSFQPAYLSSPPLSSSILQPGRVRIGLKQLQQLRSKLGSLVRTSSFPSLPRSAAMFFTGFLIQQKWSMQNMQPDPTRLWRSRPLRWGRYLWPIRKRLTVFGFKVLTNRPERLSCLPLPVLTWKGTPSSGSAASARGLASPSRAQPALPDWG